MFTPMQVVFFALIREFDIFGRKAIYIYVGKAKNRQKPGLNSWIHGLFA
jgi:hypothetical protein